MQKQALHKVILSPNTDYIVQYNNKIPIEFLSISYSFPLKIQFEEPPTTQIFFDDRKRVNNWMLLIDIIHLMTVFNRF